MNLSQNGVTSWVTYLSQNFSINFSQNFSHNLVNCQIRWWICHRIWCQFGWHICHKIWWLKFHKKWWHIQWVNKFGDKYVTISGDKFSESANLVTNFSPNLVINLVITKFGDKFVTKFVTKYPGGPICHPSHRPCLHTIRNGSFLNFHQRVPLRQKAKSGSGYCGGINGDFLDDHYGAEGSPFKDFFS